MHTGLQPDLDRNVCVGVPVCLLPRLVKISGVMWDDIKPMSLVKQVL